MEQYEAKVIKSFSYELDKCDVEVTEGEVLKVIEYQGDKSKVSMVTDIGIFRIDKRNIEKVT